MTSTVLSSAFLIVLMLLCSPPSRGGEFGRLFYDSTIAVPTEAFGLTTSASTTVDAIISGRVLPTPLKCAYEFCLAYIEEPSDCGYLK